MADGARDGDGDDISEKSEASEGQKSAYMIEQSTSKLLPDILGLNQSDSDRPSSEDTREEASAGGEKASEEAIEKKKKPRVKVQFNPEDEVKHFEIGSKPKVHVEIYSDSQGAKSQDNKSQDDSDRKSSLEEFATLKAPKKEKKKKQRMKVQFNPKKEGKSKEKVPSLGHSIKAELITDRFPMEEAVITVKEEQIPETMEYVKVVAAGMETPKSPKSVADLGSTPGEPFPISQPSYKQLVIMRQEAATAGDDQDLTRDVSMEEKAVQQAEGEREEMGSVVEETPPGEGTSKVSAAICDTIFEDKYKSYMKPNSLNLVWAFGINRDIPVYALHLDVRRVILYVSSHTAVLANFFLGRQYLLQGHCSSISCIALSGNKRWLATADMGPESLVIVWDIFSGIPVQTLFDCHPKDGVGAIAISHNAKYLGTISAGKNQRVCIWDWTSETKGPMCCVDLSPAFSPQRFFLFNPKDETELLSNSKHEIVFYTWKGNQLDFSAPVLTDQTFNKAVGLFSQSVFHHNPSQALTATSAGNLVIWDTKCPPEIPLNAEIKSYKKKALKLVHLQNDGITVVTFSDRYVVTGDVKGAIKFYSDELHIMNWYSNFNLGPISSISFSKRPAAPANEKTSYPSESTIKAQQFVVRNFIVATTDATVVHVTGDGCKLEILLQEHNFALHAICCHPTYPMLCMGSYSGLLKLWNYEEKKYICSRIFGMGNYINCIAFNNTGTLLGVGVTDGSVHILNAFSLIDECKEPFQYGKDAITQITFSHDSQYLATVDNETTVTVFVLRQTSTGKAWKYLGKHTSHFKPIQTLMFGIHIDTKEPRMLSLGEDRVLVEYDLANSTKDDLRILNSERIEQSAVPMCMAWYPPITTESFIVVANDQYKLKLYNATTRMCRKTVLGPNFGSPIKKMVIIPNSDIEPTIGYLAYIIDDKVGLQTLPLDGNPHKSCAVICHGQSVSNIACSYDGRYVFTAGGDDCTVHMWEINLQAHGALTALGGEELIPFYGLLEGGREGPLFKELEDYFYYSQLRHQNINTIDTRQATIYIALEEIPFVMNAVGFYPTQKEIEDMLNEVKFSKYVETGKFVTDVDIGEFLKLLINHRPIFGYSVAELQKCFDILGCQNENGESAIEWSVLLQLLQTRGECMTEVEVKEYLFTLLGLNPEGGTSELIAFDPTDATTMLTEQLPGEITTELFVQGILDLPLLSEEKCIPQTLPEPESESPTLQSP